MSYYPKKGMYRNKTGVHRFSDPRRDQGPQTKRWFHVEVIRRAYNGKGEVVRRNKQSTAVYAEEAEAVGMGVRRCPDPGMGDGDVRTNVYYSALGKEDNL
jgi:hypothetical protein